jgi:hypothetical protein
MSFFMRNKRGIAPLVIVLYIIAILIVLYLVLLIPIPSFTAIRTTINYFLILILWIILQVGLILGYYKLGRYSTRLFKISKRKLHNLTNSFDKFLITHT